MAQTSCQLKSRRKARAEQTDDFYTVFSDCPFPRHHLNSHDFFIFEVCVRKVDEKCRCLCLYDIFVLFNHWFFLTTKLWNKNNDVSIPVMRISFHSQPLETCWVDALSVKDSWIEVARMRVFKATFLQYGPRLGNNCPVGTLYDQVGTLSFIAVLLKWGSADS